MTIDDAFAAPSVGRPPVTPGQAAAIAREVFGVEGSVVELGSQQDRNFRIDADGGGRYLLKLVTSGPHDLQLAAQDAALRHLRDGGLTVPEPRPTLAGDALGKVTLDGVEATVRLLTFLDGVPLNAFRHLAPRVIADLGRLAGETCRVLDGFEHAGLDGARQWDLRLAGPVVRSFAPSVRSPELRERLLTATREASARLAPLAAELPQQAIHGDVTDFNVVCATGPDGRPRPFGVIDLGDLSTGWRVGELAVTCASILAHLDGDPLGFLPAVEAFASVVPLSPVELAALWPLVVLRGAVLVASDEQQLAIDPTNAYASDGLLDDVAIFAAATALPWALVEAAIEERLGASDPPSWHGRLNALVPMLPSLLEADPLVLDLSATSEALDAGRWLDPSIEDELFTAATPAGWDRPVVARYGEYRLTRAEPAARNAPASCALHVELRLPAGAMVCSPARGVVRRAAADALVLAVGDVEIHLHGVAPSVALDSGVAPGQPVGVSCGTDGFASVRVQMCREPGLEPPAFAPATTADAWLRLCPDPSPLLGRDCAAPSPDPSGALARRDRVFAPVQGHYYDAPPQIERGFREHLADTRGRAYVDMVNNVTLVGHGHPRLARAAARQWSLLNTNSRFNFGVVGEFCERLAALAPDDLDAVLLVNSGTEATDLALRLAQAHTGRPIVIAVREAYHGWSIGADAVSTSIADNPRAPDTRPSWVRLLDAPNAYRGTHPGAGAVAYAAEARAAVDRWADAGDLPAALIAEAVYGNAGGVLLPDGYLAEVYAAVRSHGGLCIADEVQVGYGRLGRFFWGFEQQGVVPDVIAVAKAMGNGHPLGAVITRREIADSLAATGSFFSSTGGSPVSCRLGLTVLDILEEEELQASAGRVGEHLLDRLRALQDRHPLIGAIHGMGLYAGVELVRDRETREPATAETAAICERFLELGVVVQPTGDRGNVLKVKPPLCLSTASADAFADRLDEILRDGW